MAARSSPAALALPSGDVFLTDELVTLAHDEDELRGALAHEVGHVVHRHAMRLLLENSASALVLAAILGDAGSAPAIAALAPAVLLSSA